MKIDRIILNHFGRFQEKELSFPDNLVVIYGLNEEGKTTILDFILLMLYGYKGTKRNAQENPRFRYIDKTSAVLPRGLMYLSSDKRRYRLERHFGSSNGQDQIDLIDDDTQEAISLAKQETPGDYLFGCDSEAFIRTYYLSSQGASFAADGKTESLNNRLQNLQDTGSEDQSYQGAINYLVKQREVLISKSGKKGDLVELREDLQDKKREYYRALDVEKEKRQDQEIIHMLQADLEELESFADQRSSTDFADGGRQREETAKPLSNGLFIIFSAIIFLFAIHQVLQGEVLLFTLLLILALAFLFVGPILFKKRYKEELVDDFPEAKNRRLQVQMDIVEAKGRMQEKYKNEPLADFVLLELGTLQEEVEGLEEELEAIDIALEELKGLTRQRAQVYLPRLNQEAEKILQALIDGPKAHLRIGSKLDLSVEEENSIWSSDYLSSSTREQVYLAMRLALIKLLEDQQSSLLLDDPFVYYDDERASSAFAYLASLSIEDDRQILLFTCQSRFIDWADQKSDIHLMSLSD